MPWTAAISSSDASCSAAIDAEVARPAAAALTEPTCGMPEPEQHGAERPLLATPRSTRSRSAADRSWKPSSSSSCSAVEPVQVARPLDQPELEQPDDELLADALDVHRAARDEVLEQLGAAARAARVDAAVAAPRPRAARPAGRRPGSARACGRPARRRRRSSSTGPTTCGITSPARCTIDGVADADVLAVDVVLVVQRRELDDDAADLDRLEDRERVQRAGAPDVDADVEQLRGARGRRELERDGPARVAADARRARAASRARRPSRRRRRSRRRARARSLRARRHASRTPSMASCELRLRVDREAALPQPVERRRGASRTRRPRRAPTA